MSEISDILKIMFYSFLAFYLYDIFKTYINIECDFEEDRFYPT